MSDTNQQTMLEQLGGISGLIYSTLPVLVFVPVNSLWGLTVAIWSALGVALAVLVWRLIQRTPIQPAISGFFGVALCAFIAHRTGDAKGYFLFGIYASLLYGGAFLLSVLVRRPLVGVIWGMLNGQGSRWRSHHTAVRAYDVATLAWTLVFLGRYLVQNHLYDEDRTGWLAVARIGMGWPLTALALLVTLWAVRRADRIVEPPPAETVDDASVDAAPTDDPAADDALSNKSRDEHGARDEHRLPGQHRLRD
ncbi:DUF3159 domain-containing protein [Rhodococcus rhodochrous]|uniref:DUF3159 domain-containing protein n=1 Tax=Rhodococcus rhodochrous TaxID=1829 RepID=UPI001320D359|nr:DUF3159 domain-containing protein [Rhodococcus rhodochrous]